MGAQEAGQKTGQDAGPETKPETAISLARKRGRNGPPRGRRIMLLGALGLHFES